MLKGFLNSLFVVPVLLGVFAATRARGRQSLWLLLGLLLAYETTYVLFLYYLRMRWVG
jgi:hypothetical protein